MINLLQQAREFIAQLIDRQPTMLLYDLGYTEERSDEELLRSDLEAITERLERIRKDNEDYVYGIVDEIMEQYGFGSVSLPIEPYKIPLLGKDNTGDWLGSTSDQELFPSGVKFQWTPWEDRDGDGSNTFGLGLEASATSVARWMTTNCHYCHKTHQFGASIPFSQEFYRAVLEKDGWKESPAGYHICPICWPGLFND